MFHKKIGLQKLYKTIRTKYSEKSGFRVYLQKYQKLDAQLHNGPSGLPRCMVVLEWWLPILDFRLKKFVLIKNVKRIPTNKI